MLNYIITILLVSLGASWILTIAYKWDIIDYMQRHAPCDIISRMLSCDFCLSFWTGMAISIVLSMILHDYTMLFIPIFSANITKYII